MVQKLQDGTYKATKRGEGLKIVERALRRYAVYDGVADYYVYFLELAQRIARRWCLIVPNKWLTAAYGRPLRAFLAGRVEGLVDFGRALPLFRNADAFPCIVWGTIGSRAFDSINIGTCSAPDGV